jgi:broad specificity phosphatase PhoE
MAIWLGRHGETALNAARVLQMPETPLSEHGLSQAARLAERVRALPIARVISSDFTRAAMTAELAARALGLQVELDPLLQERSFGALRGKPYAELPHELFDPEFAPPGGETWQEFRERVARAWAAISERAAALEGDLLVVSHGLVCAVVTEHLDPARAPRAFPNACLTRFDGPPWRVGLLACTAHLVPAGGAGSADEQARSA